MIRTTTFPRVARRGAASTSALAVLPLLLLSAACSDATTASSAHRVNLMVSTARAAAAATAAVASAPARGDLALASAGGTLDITRAQLVVARTELAGATAAGCAGDDRGHDDCEELKLGPMLVDLPLTDGAVSVLTAAVPAGTYSRLEAKIMAVRDGDSGASSFLAANPTFRGVSVRVEGTFDGQPFVYTANNEAELEMAFDPPVTVGADGVSLTVHVDLARWFVDGAGNLIDPRSAAAGGANAQLVASNIARSFEAFEDENHDGHDDHGRDGGGHGGDDHGSGH